MNLDVVYADPIKRGWLNLKWVIGTNKGVFLLKQYNKERLKLSNLDSLSLALSQQIRLYSNGIPCPKLMVHKDEIWLTSNLGERFIIMEYCKGDVIPPGKLNSTQMFSLGSATGKMHRVINDGSLDKENSPQFVPPSRKERLMHWSSTWEKAFTSGLTHLLPYIEIQQEATKLVEIEEFETVETGWAHRDLWMDNLLFSAHGLSAILDFDRMRYDYPKLDIARAIISGALNADGIDLVLVRGFLEGYRQERSFPKGSLVTSLKMLWYLESTWWINEKMDDHSIPPARFAQEMNWLAANMHKLDAMLGDL